MTAPRDKFGRPIVVVTGMGIVTSLGAGKTDNWKKLTAGESGIRTITRFPTEGLKTTMAGAIDFVPVEPFSSTDLSERLADIAAEEAIAQSAIGSSGVGVSSSWPGQKGQWSMGVASVLPRSDGRAARSGATITHRRLNGSRRSCGAVSLIARPYHNRNRCW